MTQPLKTMTVEHLARALGKMNTSFNTQAAVSFSDRHNIARVKRTHYDSFKSHLTSLGVSEHDALTHIHGKHFIQK